MPGGSATIHTQLVHAIKRHAKSAEGNRYANSLPQYEVADDLPDRFVDLLDRIEAAEAKANRQR